MTTNLEPALREKLGSRWARRLRLQGRIPCSLQGEGKPNVDFSIVEHEFLAARRHHEHLFDLPLGGESASAIVRELQWDAFGDRILHIEFRRVVRGRKTEAEVELTFRGHPKAGVLNHAVSVVTVMALPTEIPDTIVVNVDHLEEGHAIHARDIVLPEGIDLETDPDVVIASVTVAGSPQVAAPEAEGEEAAEGEAETEGAEE